MKPPKFIFEGILLFAILACSGPAPTPNTEATVQSAVATRVATLTAEGTQAVPTATATATFTPTPLPQPSPTAFPTPTTVLASSPTPTPTLASLPTPTLRPSPSLTPTVTPTPRGTSTPVPRILYPSRADRRPGDVELNLGEAATTSNGIAVGVISALNQCTRVTDRSGNLKFADRSKLFFRFTASFENKGKEPPLFYWGPLLRLQTPLGGVDRPYVGLARTELVSLSSTSILSPEDLFYGSLPPGKYLVGEVVFEAANLTGRYFVIYEDGPSSRLIWGHDHDGADDRC